MKSTPKISLISLNYLQTYLNSLFLTIFKRISKDLSHVMSEFLSYVLGELRKGVVTQIIFRILWFSGTPKSGFPRLQVASSLTLSVSLSLSLSLLSNSGYLLSARGLILSYQTGHSFSFPHTLSFSTTENTVWFCWNLDCKPVCSS